MGRYNNNLGPVHQGDHYVQLRSIMKEIADYEYVDHSKYDFTNMRGYFIDGKGLNGKNIKFKTNNGKGIFKWNSQYDVIEAPAKSNNYRSYYGEFLLLTWDRAGHFVQFAVMTVKLDKDKSKKLGKVIDTVHITPFGKYVLKGDNGDALINKKEYGFDFTPGNFPHQSEIYFDSKDVRREKAYHSNKKEVLKSLGVTKSINTTSKINSFKSRNKDEKYTTKIVGNENKRGNKKRGNL